MATWITSDLHFSHANIQKFCPATRGHYEDVVDMNERMISEWNARVAPDDTVYILGDVAFCSADKAAEMVNRLNGVKHLIVGNHDEKNLKQSQFRACFASVQHYLRLVYEKRVVVMSHFPFLEWDQMHRGSLHFFGHVHGNKTGQESFRCMDVGMDATGQVVTLLDDAINKICNNDIKQHH